MASSYNRFVIAVLTVLAGALVLAAVVLLARSDENAPIQIVLPTPEEPASPLIQGEIPLSAPGSRKTEFKVYISGAVRNPGVYTLQPGDRLGDALAAAGGAVDGADLEAVNLARRVQDEAYYHVPRVGETPRPAVETASAPPRPAASASSESAPDSALIDLNDAPLALLETLPGIGQVRAQAIVDYRERNGPLKSVEEITRVQGIGATTYEQIRDLVTVGGAP